MAIGFGEWIQFFHMFTVAQVPFMKRNVRIVILADIYPKHPQKLGIAILYRITFLPSTSARHGLFWIVSYF